MCSGSALEFESRDRGFESYSGHFHSHKLSRLTFSFVVLVFLCNIAVAKEALIYAHQLGMTNGTYAFILVEMSPVKFNSRINNPFQWVIPEVSEEFSSTKALKQAFKTALLLGPTVNQRNKEVARFIHQLKGQSNSYPFYSDYYERNDNNGIVSMSFRSHNLSDSLIFIHATLELQIWGFHVKLRDSLIRDSYYFKTHSYFKP